MADHAHDVCDFRRGGDAADLALGADGRGHLVLVGLEDGGLVQTDGGRVDVEVCEDDVRIIDAGGEAEVRGERERDVEQDVVEVAVARPELALEVGVLPVAVWTVQMDEIAAEETGHQTDAGVWREARRAVGGHGLFQRHAGLGAAPLECIFRGGEVCQNLAVHHCQLSHSLYIYLSLRGGYIYIYE